MTDLSKLSPETAIITDVARKSSSLILDIFKKSFGEIDHYVADNIRFRRLKNQIKILEKTKLHIREGNIKLNQIDLKVLAPLLELSSLEEDKQIQDLWSNLIANILTKEFDIVFAQNSINILNRISNVEISVINHLFEKLEFKREERFARLNTRQTQIHKTYKDLRIDTFSFQIKKIAQDLEIEENKFEIIISNLVALGTLKYDTTIDIVSAQKSSDDPEDTDLDLDIDLYDYHDVRITRLGYAFVELCKAPKTK